MPEAPSSLWCGEGGLAQTHSHGEMGQERLLEGFQSLARPRPRSSRNPSGDFHGGDANVREGGRARSERGGDGAGGRAPRGPWVPP